MIRCAFAPFRSVAIGSLFVVVTLGSLEACGGHPEPAVSPAGAAGTPAAAPRGAMKEPGDAKIGDTTKCAVSGEEMTVEASSPKTEYQGKTYFFCCSGCKKKFEADPAKYVKKS